MNQIAFFPSGCNQALSCSSVTTKTHLCYATNLSLYLHSNSESDQYSMLHVLTGPQATISSFTVNEKLVACVTPNDKTMYLWSVTSGEPYENIPTSFFADCIPICVAARPTSSTLRDCLAIGCTGGRIILWNIQDGKSINLQVSSSTIITCCRWSPLNPRILVVGTDSGSVVVVDSVNQTIISEIDCFDGLRPSKETFFDRLLNDSPKVTCVAFDPKSANYLLAGSAKGYLVLIDLEARVVVQAFDPSPHPFSSVSFVEQHPGSFVTADGTTALFQYWNVSVKQSLRSAKPKSETGIKGVHGVPTPSNADASPQAARLMVEFRDGSVSLFNLDQNRIEMLDTTPAHSDTVFECRFSPKSADVMASCSCDGYVKIWNIKQMQLTTSINVRKPIYSLQWSPSGDQIVVTTASGEVAMYSVTSGKEIWRKKLFDDFLWKVVWNTVEPGILAVACRDGTAAVLGAADGSVLRVYRHGSSVYGLDFEPTIGKALAVACYDSKIRLYHLEQGSTSSNASAAALAALVGHDGQVSNVIFNQAFPDILASTGNDKTVRIWKLPDAVLRALRTSAPPAASTEPYFVQPLYSMTGHVDRTRAITWNPLCPYLLHSGSWDASLRTWDVRTGTCMNVARGHAADVYCIHVHPSRPTIAVTASRDTTIRFWYAKVLSQVHLDAAVGLLKELVVDPSSIAIGPTSASTSSAQAAAPDAPLLCCGSPVQALATSLSRDLPSHQRLKLITDFFDFPNGGADVVSCAAFRASKDVMTIDRDATVAPTDYVASVAVTAANAQMAELRKRQTAAAGSSRRERELRQLAVEYIRLGNTKQYCELMFEATDIDAAIAAAPGVSTEYWKQLCVRAVEVYNARGEYDTSVNLLVACGEAIRAADVLANCGNYTEAVVVVQSCLQAQPSGTASMVASVDARVAANKIFEFAKANADRYLNEGSPLMACASLIAADVIDRALELVLRSACVPLGHLLFHTLPVTQQLIDYGFSQALLTSASNRRWRTARLLLERLSPGAKLGAAADALAMVVSEASYSAAYRYQVEQTLEAFFQATQATAPADAELGVSLWNCVTQPSMADAARHTDVVHGRCTDLLRRTVELLSTIFSATNPASQTAQVPPNVESQLLQCRRWIHWTVHTDSSSVAARQSTLFLAFLCAALIGKFVYGYDRVVASAVRLANAFAQVDPSNYSPLMQSVTQLFAAIKRPLVPGSLRCLPQGAKIPCHMSRKSHPSSQPNPIVGHAARGPCFYLEDQQTDISLQEALEWHRCCWFSPLATGQRILPY